MPPRGITSQGWPFSSRGGDSRDDVKADSVGAASARAPEVNETPGQRPGIREVRSLLHEYGTLLTGERYIRHSESQSISRSLQDLAKLGPHDTAGLQGDELRVWQDLVRYAGAEKFEAVREQYNRAHVDRQLAVVHTATSADMPRSLTDEQGPE